LKWLIIFFEGFKSKKEIIATIQDLQLSRNTIMWRIEKICGNITEQLLKDVYNYVAFSLQLDESADIRDTAQLVVFIQMIFEEISVKELLGIISIKGRTTGRKYLILSILSQSLMFHYINLFPLLLMGQNQ
jgi:hypothetical protein